MGSSIPPITPGPIPEKLASAVEGWLRYFSDLGVRSFYLDRASPTFAGEDARPAGASSPGEEMEPLPKQTVKETPLASVKSQSIPGVAAALAANPAPSGELRAVGGAMDLRELAHPPSLFAGTNRVSETLEVISADLGDCTRCKLHTTRNKIVFGAGNPHAELVFVGEGPGHDEDMQGIPFVGRAGKLLTQMIEAMGLRRDDVYIANVVKCRPPENRQPQPDEVETCMPFLLRQLAAIGPKVIVCLGSTAAQSLLETKRGISHFRGQWLEFHGTKLMATYHPAYLLRNPNAKPEVWTDLQKVMAELGLKLPPRNASRPSA